MGFFPCDIPSTQPLAVVPVLVGPLQALLAILPGLLVALGTAILALFKPSTFKKLGLLLWSQKIVVLAIVAVIAGGWWGIPKLLPPPDVSARIAGTDWSVWRGGVERRGAVTGGEDPARGYVNWRFVDGKIKAFYASPAVVGNRVYITSAEPVFDKGAIYSIDTVGGEAVWRYSAEDTDRAYLATFSSPSVSGKYLVVGEGLHFTRNARVFCLDVEASEKKRAGVRLWSFETKSHVESSPAIADGKAVIGAGDDGLYCLALEPDENGNAKVLWHLPGKDYPDCEAAPVIHEGKVYFSLGINGNAVVCVDATSGKELWRHDTGYPVFGSPTIADGKLFVGMGPGNFMFTAEEVAAQERAKLKEAGKTDAEIEQAVKDIRPFGKVIAIDLADGRKLWEYEVGRTVLGAIAAADGKLYFGSRDGFLYCITTTGELVRKWNARAPIVTSPAVAASHVYVLTRTGYLYTLTRGMLDETWELDLKEQTTTIPTMSSPTVAHGRVYVGTSSNGLVCAGEPDVGRRPLWAGALGGPGRSGWIGSIELSDRGRFGWRQWDTESGGMGGEPVSITAAPACLDGALYAGVSAKSRRGLVKLELGRTDANRPETRWFVPTTNDVVLSTAASDNAVYVVDGRKGDAGRALQCLDAGTGEVLWRHDVAADASGQFFITYETLWIVDRADGFTSLRLDPDDPRNVSRERTWSTGPVAGLPIVLDDIVIAATSNGPALAAFDRPTGRALWRRELASVPLSGPVLAGGLVWLGGPEGLTAHDLTTGGPPMGPDNAPMPPVACGKVSVPLVADDTLLACVSDAGEMLLVDPATGKTLRTIPKAAALPPVLAGKELLYYDGKSIVRYEIGSRRGRTQAWFKLADVLETTLTSPMIVVDSAVYAGTDTQGLICVKPPEKK